MTASALAAGPAAGDDPEAVTAAAPDDDDPGQDEDAAAVDGNQVPWNGRTPAVAWVTRGLASSSRAARRGAR